MNECHFELEGNIFKPSESENVFFVNTKGNKEVTSVAIIIDGADGRKKHILSNGQEVDLLDLLKDEIAKGALNSEKDLPRIVSDAIKGTYRKFSKTDAASVLVARINNGNFEAFSNGGCGMIIRYQDGVIESLLGKDATYLRNSDHIETFAQISKISRDRHRNLSTYTDGVMWNLDTRAYNIRNVALFSDGIKPAFMNNKIIEEFISAPNKKDAMKLLEMLSALGAILRENEPTVVVQSGKMQKNALINRTALFFNLVDQRD